MNSNVQLTDGAVLLRPYLVQDLDALHAATIGSMDELMPYMGWMHEGYSIDESRSWIANCERAWREGTSCEFAITDARSGTYLGGCGLNGLDAEHRIANLGYWVATSMTRRGVATSATKLLARFGFEELGLKRIGVVIAVPNKASRRVAEKAGATQEGVLRNALFVRDLMYDSVVFSFIPEDFKISEQA